MIELVQLGGYGERKPSQLSGGQQQRVALGRALINEPGVLLLDEPLGALDLKLRRQMQIELKRIQTEVGITFVHVTHDQEEAMTMADSIAVMNQGVIEQMGAPGDLYENPSTTFVANFLGQSNLIRSEVLDGTGDEVVVDCNGQKVAVNGARNHCDGHSAWLGIRPEKIFVSEAGTTRVATARTGSPAAGSPTSASWGSAPSTSSPCPGAQELMVFEQNTGQRAPLRNGTEVDLAWSAAHAFLLDAAAGRDRRHDEARGRRVTTEAAPATGAPPGPSSTASRPSVAAGAGCCWSPACSGWRSSSSSPPSSSSSPRSTTPAGPTSRATR